MTPSIYPGELLVGAKTQYYRGSFPMPWLSEGFFMAKEDELYQAALASGSASADQVSAYGAGGGNVTEVLVTLFPLPVNMVSAKTKFVF